MTLYVKPFVRWIWLGAIFMAIGGTLAAGDKRYRRLRIKAAEKSAWGLKHKPQRSCSQRNAYISRGET